MGKGQGGDGYYVRGGHAVIRPSTNTSVKESIGAHVKEHLHTGPKGLQNVGNTCYANAALQCLLSTALTHALMDRKAAAIFRRYSSNPNILAQGSGSVDSAEEEQQQTGSKSKSGKTKRTKRELEDRRMRENCKWLTTELKQITLQYHQDNSSRPWWFGTTHVVDPSTITRHPHRLSQCLRPYQQEDAHEFLRALLGTLVMHGQNRQLSSLFDGLLESAVTCMCCGRPSLTRDRYMDLSLDIHANHINSLNEALAEFTKTETLTGDNKVFCSNCNVKKPATKGLRLATAPTILVCHFKRFAFDQYGRLIRLHKRVDFPLQLEIGDYMSKVNKSRPPPYNLVAVLVHQGQTCESGHYLAYVKNNGDWYRCNDSEVTRVDLATVKKQQAYILMYEVADMRENHGYPSPHHCGLQNPPWQDEYYATSSPRSTTTSGIRDFTLSSLMCGADQVFLNDVCCNVFTTTPPQRRFPKVNVNRKDRCNSGSDRDEVSTLGESTVTSTDMRRSASSSNLMSIHQQQLHHHYESNNINNIIGTAESPRSRIFSSYNNNSTSALPTTTTYNCDAAKKWSSELHLPPRPDKANNNNNNNNNANNIANPKQKLRQPRPEHRRTKSMRDAAPV